MPDAPVRAPEHEQFLAAARATVPPVVYLPVRSADTGAYEVELRTTLDGRVALLAYTALDRLAACCGPHQPWVLQRTDRLQELEQSQPYDVVYLDLELPEELRRSAPEEVPGD